MASGSDFLHGSIMKGLVFFWFILSMIILNEDLKSNRKEAFQIQPKEKDS